MHTHTLVQYANRITFIYSPSRNSFVTNRETFKSSDVKRTVDGTQPDTYEVAPDASVGCLRRCATGSWLVV